MSYLLFDSAYTRTLVDLGRRDAELRIAELEAFVRSAPPLTLPAAAVHPLRAARRQPAQLWVTSSAPP